MTLKTCNKLQNNVEEIKKIVSSYDIPLIINSIEDVFSITLDDSNTNSNILNVVNKGKYSNGG